MDEGVGVLVGVGTVLVVGVGVVCALTVTVLVVAFTKGKLLLIAVMVWEPAVLRVILKTPVPLLRRLSAPGSGKCA